MGIFHGTLGAPELVARKGQKFRLTQRYTRIDGHSGIRTYDLAQLDGTLLALDWVVGNAHHIWGSAVMVAPGVALTARHVVDGMRDQGFLGQIGGYLLAIGIHDDGMAIWNPNSFTCIGEGDLAILTLVRVTEEPADKVIPVNVATLAARLPLVGENISLGFRATEVQFEKWEAGAMLLGSVGPVIDIYPERRDRALPNPSIAVAARTINGMSGGAAFDAQGRLIGIISRGIGEEPSFISLSWPSVFTPIQVAWPPGLIPEPASLDTLARRGFCWIEGIEGLRSYASETGEPVAVTLTCDRRDFPQLP